MATPHGDPTQHGHGNLPFAVTWFGSEARTATPSTKDGTAATVDGSPVCQGCQAITVIINVTAKTSTPSVVFTIEGNDPASGTWYPIATLTAVDDVTSTPIVVKIGKDITPVTDDETAVNCPVPERLRISAAHGNANSITYSVGVVFS